MEDDGWQGFLRLVLKSKGPEELDELMNLYLTIEEKKDIGLRYQIIKELVEGKRTQRDMASHLKVSIAKITRGSNALKRLEAHVKRVLEEYLRN